MSKEEIKINEKVKFWEEQDRINQSLIPRVLKMHEMIEGLSKTINSYSTAFGTLEAKLTKSFKEETKSITDFHDSLSKLSDELLDLSEKNKKSLDSIVNEKKEMDTKLEAFLLSQESELNRIKDDIISFQNTTSQQLKNNRKQITIIGLGFALFLILIIILFN